MEIPSSSSSLISLPPSYFLVGDVSQYYYTNSSSVAINKHKYSHFIGLLNEALFRIRGQKGMERHALLIDKHMLIGWDNLLIRGKFTKEWRICQKAYVHKVRLKNPILHAEKMRKKKKDKEKNKSKQKNRTEAFHTFFLAIVPSIKEM